MVASGNPAFAQYCEAIFELDEDDGDPPDGVFFSWVGQLRFLYRFEASGVELGLRGDLQLTDRPILPLEQFAIGGPGSVRDRRGPGPVHEIGGSSRFVDGWTGIGENGTGHGLVQGFGTVGPVHSHGGECRVQ